MACLKAPAPPLPPPLPSGVTISVFTPPSPINVEFCCQIALLEFPIPPIALPIAIPAALMTILSTYTAAVQAYEDATTINCPLA